MGVIASLDQSSLAVAPGGQATAVIRVRNTGSVVDQLSFEPVGAAAPWIEIEPPTLSLFPGAEAAATVRFAPPRVAAVQPGPTPFAIRVLSREDPMGSVAEEGVIDVGAFAQRAIELYPTTSRGRSSAQFQIAVDNRGNTPIEVVLSGSDAENACKYRFAADILRLEPGAAAFTKLRVSPAKRFWKGPPKTHQFQVVANQEGVEPEQVKGTMLQEAMLPPWLVKAVLLLLGLILLLWILWLTLFKSTVESTARDAVAAPLSSLEERLDEVAPTTGGGGGQPTTTAGGSGGSTTTVPGGVTTTVPGGVTTTTSPDGSFSTSFGDPADFQLGGTSVAAGATQNFTQPFSSDFALTDVVLQNPGGDAGLVQVLRGNQVLFTSALQNFRDLDLHFVAPYVFESGESLVLRVQCTTPGPLITPGCDVSASFAGFEK